MEEELGKKFGKRDTERIGIFSEMPYMIGKKYVSPFQAPTFQGKSMLSGNSKIKAGWQDCYFDKQFKRIFTGEAIKGRGKKEKVFSIKLQKKPPLFKNVSDRPFMPPSNPKWHGCPGDWHGTFACKMDAFSNKSKPQPPYKHQIGNPTTSPVKKGGCGYVNICINPYPEHSIEKYTVRKKFKEYGKILSGPLVLGMHPKPYFEKNPFKNPNNIKAGPTYVPPKEKAFKMIPPGKLIPTGPAKWQGGCHAGCFNKFPEHKPDKYLTPWDANKTRKQDKKLEESGFYPPSYGERTLYTCSTVNENVRFRVNTSNYKTYEPTFIKHLVNKR